MRMVTQTAPATTDAMSVRALVAKHRASEMARDTMRALGFQQASDADGKTVALAVIGRYIDILSRGER